MVRIGILCRRILLFPEIAMKKFLYKNGSFACSDAIFWKESLRIVMCYFSFFCIWNNELSSNSLKKISPAVNSSICLSGTIPLEKGQRLNFMEQTCCCKRVKLCSAVIFVWQVCDKSIMICVSHSLKTFDFQRLPNDVGFLIKAGWIMLLFPCQSCSDCHLHHPIPILSNGCPKQESVAGNCCDVMMIAACGVFFLFTSYVHPVKDHLR